MTTLRDRDRGDVMHTQTVERIERGFPERLGGRWAVSVQGFTVACLTVLVGVTSHVLSLDARDGLVFLAATFMVFVVSGLIDGVLHKTRWSQRRVNPVPVAEVLARLFVVGTGFSVAYAIVRTTFDIDTPIGAVEGFILYPAVSMWVGSSLIVYLDVIDQARHIRQVAIQERSRSEEMRHRADDAADQLRKKVDELLSPEIDRLKHVVTHETYTVVPQEIRSVVDRSVRGVGHELWQTGSHDFGRVSLFEIIRATILYPVLRPWPMIGLAIVIPVFQAGETTNPAVLLLSVIAAVVVYVECTIANAVMKRWPSLRAVVIGAVILVFTAQTLLVDQLGENWGQTSEDPGFVVILILTACLILVTSTLGSYRDLNDQRAHNIAEEIAVDRLDTAAHAHALSEEARRLAALLHGRVQSRLLGCAMALEFAKNDSDALRDALSRTMDVLAENWRESEMATGDALSAIESTWSGLADVRIVLSGEDPALVTKEVVIVVEELVSNAVRHGRATHVDVEIRQSDDGWCVSAADNGSSTTVHRPGLGTEVLAHVGLVEQYLSSEGSTVTVRLPK